MHLATLYGLDDAFKSIEFSGRSDFAIFEDALRNAGVSDGEFHEAMRKFKHVYYRHLPASLLKHEGRVLPGVELLLDELSRELNATLAPTLRYAGLAFCVFDGLSGFSESN